MQIILKKNIPFYSTQYLLLFISATVVISSSGWAAKHLGGALGQYEYHEDKGYYVQTSTEQSEKNFEAYYLSRDEDGKWWVGTEPGVNAGFANNPQRSKTPPISGWVWGDGDSWLDDRTLTVTPGPLPYLPRQFTVTATGVAEEKYPSYLGVFTKSERWWNGRPVYVNTEGVFLYHGKNGDGWTMSDTLGIRVLWGSKSRQTPSMEKNWIFWNGSEYPTANITVTGSGQTEKRI